jgi:dihydroorotate dehydrogenase
MNLYHLFLKPLLFLLPPEKAHALALTLLELPGMTSLFRQPASRNTPVTTAGLTFPNRVGLAAGFDKNGRHIQALATLGFGFIEVGTVTPKAQPGNPQPRLFRLPKDEALINRLGFNNDGLDALIKQLQQQRPAGLIIGGNIGKNKDTPIEAATDDYLRCFEALYPYVDYFTVNVSSPNTPNLRALQDKEPLTLLLSAIHRLNHVYPSPKPVFLKIAPDLSLSQLDDIVDIAITTQLAGIIATNTTIQRTALRTPPDVLADIGAGGLSGPPLRTQATDIIRYLRQKLPPPFTIIGVGGINSAPAALEKLEAGADLIQLYTGFVYEGPAIVTRILKGIANFSPAFPHAK